MSVAPRILVLGGAGFYGHYLVEDVLANTNATIVVASRYPRRMTFSRVTTTRCDVRDLDSILSVVDGCVAMVNCTGPFYEPRLNPLRAAIRAHVAYVDIGEGREHMRGVLELTSKVESLEIVVLPGASVVPGLVALFANYLATGLDEVRSVRAFAAPDTKRHRGPAMFRTMLHGVGARFELPTDGRMRTVHGWTEPEWVDFPAPLQGRLTYLVLEMADIDVLPRTIGARTVAFKAGTEFPTVNRLLNLAARVRIRFGGPPWEHYAPLLRAISWLVGRFGRDEGGVVFEVIGRKGGVASRQRLALIAEHDGGRIPAVLAAIAVEEILAGRLTGHGVVPLNAWIPSDRLIAALRRRGLPPWISTEDHRWTPLIDFTPISSP